MSKNVAQVLAANPVTTVGATDTFYLAQGNTTDAAITGANLKASLSPLTTKGDLYTFSTVNARLAVGVTNGQILQVSSGAATGLAWSTPTYPSASGTSGKILISDGTNNVYSTPTYPNSATTTGSFIYANGTNYVASTSLWPNTVGTAGKIIRSDGTVNAYTTSTFADTYGVSTILYASSANTISGLATANSATLVTNGSGVPAWQALTAGQILVGTTASAPAATTISSGTGITVTSASGSITVSLSGAGPGTLTWNDVSGTSQAAAVNNGYIISNAGQTTVTLPATAAEGSVFAVQGKGAAGWILQANTGQVIHLGSSATSSAGSLTSTNQWDSVIIVCVTADTTFAVTSVIGNLTVA